MHRDCERILFTQEEIAARSKELAKEIDEYYHGEPIVLVALLKGSVPFLAELSKYIESDVTFEYMKVSSYEGVQSKTLVVKQDINKDLNGLNILLVEDILDTGRTLFNVKEMLVKRGAKSVKIVTLLDKVDSRLCDIYSDWHGFDCPNEFVIGFGLDYNESYRQLPYIGVLKKEVYM